MDFAPRGSLDSADQMVKGLNLFRGELRLFIRRREVSLQSFEETSRSALNLLSQLQKGFSLGSHAAHSGICDRMQFCVDAEGGGGAGKGFDFLRAGDRCGKTTGNNRFDFARGGRAQNQDRDFAARRDAGPLCFLHIRDAEPVHLVGERSDNPLQTVAVGIGFHNRHESAVSPGEQTTGPRILAKGLKIDFRPAAEFRNVRRRQSHAVATLLHFQFSLNLFEITFFTAADESFAVGFELVPDDPDLG